MRLFLNIVKWLAIVVAGLIVILFSLSMILQDNVIAIFLKSVNTKLSTRVIVGSYDLSLLRKFPKAAVELKNVTVLSSPDFDRSQFPGLNTDTLLKGESVSLEFSMRDLIKGNYKIGSITIRNGSLNLYSDSSGGINYNITYDSKGTSNDEFEIDLEKINVAGLKTSYTNTATKLNIAGIIENGRIKSKITGTSIDFMCNSSLRISNFNIYSTRIRANALASIDVNLHQSDSGIVFRKSTLSLEGFNFALSGFIGSDNMMDLKLTGQNIDLARVKKYIPEKFQKTFSEYSPAGILMTDCRIRGILSRTLNPEIDLKYSLKNGRINYLQSAIKVNDLSVAGRFTNGILGIPATSVFDIEQFSFNLGSASYNGDLSVSDFDNPLIKMSVSGEIIPSEVLSFIKIPEITEAEGSFRVNMKIAGNFISKSKYSLSDFIDLNPEVNIQFKSFGIRHRNDKLSVDDIDGNIMFAKNLWAEDLVFNYKGQRFKINGEFTNLPAWIAGKPVYIKAVADISAGNLNPEIFMSDSTVSALEHKTAYILPAGIEVQLNCKIDNLVYKTFSAARITGVLTYRSGLLNFKSLNINTLNGSVSGNYLLAQNRDKSFVSRGNFEFNNIDVNLAFKSFKNFGQDFIVADNLAGSLSGSLSLLMPLDSLFNPEIRLLTAEGKYTLTDGALINFEPVKELSSFIELSELENIKFSKLENDLFIRNNYLAVPQMDIKSSAADFTISGKHDFNNNYEYHIKTYLSEVLSKKAKKQRKNPEDFGAIEDDKLGRTSIFLKITGNDEDLKVTYDLKAAGGNIKQNLKNEKGNLKNILNEEYGWFKRDTTLRQEPAPKPKFRIEWSESDSTVNKKDTTSLPKDKGISRIFKKKKQ